MGSQLNNPAGVGGRGGKKGAGQLKGIVPRITKIKTRAPRKFGIKDFLPISIFNKGGVVSNTKSKFKGHF